jgi:hypothetical protein
MFVVILAAEDHLNYDNTSGTMSKSTKQETYSSVMRWAVTNHFLENRDSCSTRNVCIQTTPSSSVLMKTVDEFSSRRVTL